MERKLGQGESSATGPTSLRQRGAIAAEDVATRQSWMEAFEWTCYHVEAVTRSVRSNATPDSSDETGGRSGWRHLLGVRRFATALKAGASSRTQEVAHAVAPAVRSKSTMWPCPRLVAHASGVAQGSSSPRFVGAPRASNSSTMSGKSLRAAQASGVEQ